MDLSLPHASDRITELVNTCNILGAHLGPPCGTCSKARGIPLPDGSAGPQPLRSDEFLLGLLQTASCGTFLSLLSRWLMESSTIDTLVHLGVREGRQPVSCPIATNFRRCLFSVRMYRRMNMKVGVMTMTSDASILPKKLNIQRACAADMPKFWASFWMLACYSRSFHACFHKPSRRDGNSLN